MFSVLYLYLMPGHVAPRIMTTILTWCMREANSIALGLWSVFIILAIKWIHFKHMISNWNWNFKDWNSLSGLHLDNIYQVLILLFIFSPLNSQMTSSSVALSHPRRSLCGQMRRYAELLVGLGDIASGLPRWPSEERLTTIEALMFIYKLQRLSLLERLPKLFFIFMHTAKLRDMPLTYCVQE